MRKFLAALLALFIFSAPAFAGNGVGAAAQTCALVSVANTSTQVNLNSQSSFITIVNTDATATIYFSTVSPATTSNFPILPNAAFSYGGMAVNKFWLISGSGTVTAGVMAH